MTSTRITTPPKTAPASPPPPPAEPWTIASARALYNIEGWGIGFFDINEAGHVVVRPDRAKDDRELDLFDLANELEQLSEVDVLLKVADELGVNPTAGVRIKLYSEGSGRWAKSGGEKSKFGLSTAQLVRLVDKLRGLGRLDILKLIHFHLGSQITDIRYIKAGLQGITRYYPEKRGLGGKHPQVRG